ncbi:YopX family protein [Helicobacter canis]|uniref:YopX family protein n=1 Tax=Helicobacter canis TaxID=29419 RepID=UPI002941D0B7|nr:YopX family protein [Helicobacter canis]
MKLADFDFRVWNRKINSYVSVTYQFEEGKASFVPREEGGVFECIELWTGMRDKNSKKIYEGDIVLMQENKEAEFFPLYLDDKHRKRDIKFLISQPFIIKLTELEPFVFDAYDITTQGIAYPLEKIRDFVFEVVGNIHENAELLDNHNKEQECH